LRMADCVKNFCINYIIMNRYPAILVNYWM
jgi:hypothetical protein